LAKWVSGIGAQTMPQYGDAVAGWRDGHSRAEVMLVWLVRDLECLGDGTVLASAGFGLDRERGACASQDRIIE
jgi:hypothetical protein